MSTEAPAAPISVPTPIPGNSPASLPDKPSGLAEAAKAQVEYERTGVKPQPAKSIEKVQQKPAEKPQPKPGEAPKKTALDAIKSKEEPAKAAPDDKEPEDDMSKQKRWTELKAAEKRLRELEPEHEMTRKERDELKALKASIDAERKELEEFRKERDFRDFTKTEKYLKDVEQPFQSVQAKATEAAEYAEVDPRALMRAMQEPNSFKREKAIMEVLESGKNEIKAGNIADLVQAGGQLQKVFETAEKYKQEASLLKEQHENGRAAEKLQADTEAQEVLKKAHKEIRDTLKVKAGDVLDDEMLQSAMDAAAAGGSDDPMDRAYRSQSEYLVPALIQKVRALQAQIDEKAAAVQAEVEARPKARPDATRQNGKAAPYSSMSDALRAHKEAGAHL